LGPGADEGGEQQHGYGQGQAREDPEKARQACKHGGEAYMEAANFPSIGA
jgi:hypothetical protein